MIRDVGRFAERWRYFAGDAIQARKAALQTQTELHILGQPPGDLLGTTAAEARAFHRPDFEEVPANLVKDLSQWKLSAVADGSFPWASAEAKAEGCA